MNRQEAFDRVRHALAEVLSDTGIDPGEIMLDSSLITDLQLQSLLFVDLTVTLEAAFGLGEFPMQDWLDEQLSRQDDGFRVSALVDTCFELTSAARDFA